MTAEPIEKIVVFTADPNFSVRSGIRAVLDAFDSVSVHVLVHRPKRRKSRLIRNQFRNLKKHGIAWIPYQAGDVCARVLYRNEPTAACGPLRPGKPVHTGLAGCQRPGTGDRVPLGQRRGRPALDRRPVAGPGAVAGRPDPAREGVCHPASGNHQPAQGAAAGLPGNAAGVLGNQGWAIDRRMHRPHGRGDARYRAPSSPKPKCRSKPIRHPTVCGLRWIRWAIGWWSRRSKRSATARAACARKPARGEPIPGRRWGWSESWAESSPPRKAPPASCARSRMRSSTGSAWPQAPSGESFPRGRHRRSRCFSTIGSTMR